MFNLNLANKTLLQTILSEVTYKGVKILLILLFLIALKEIGNILIAKILNSRMRVAKKLNGRLEERRETLKAVLRSILNISITIVGVLTILPELGINITPLLAGAGILGLAIGMGANNLVKDFISGFFILLEDQYRVGEKVKLSGVDGKVKDFDLRKTIIENEEGVLYFIPNGQITKASNLSRKKRDAN